MEEQLIIAVSGRPVLYNVDLYAYRDRTKKDAAWAAVSSEVKVPGNYCEYLCFVQIHRGHPYVPAV